MSSAVPDGWEVKRLGELCNSVRGVSYKPDDLYSIKSDSTATLLRSNNIQSGQLIFNNVKFVDRRKVKERQIVRTGDIAICMSNGSKRLVGKNGIFPQTHQSDILTVGAFCSIIRTKEGGNETFISQVLKSDEFFKQVEFSLAGSAINNLKDGDVEDYLFSFPPLPEQKKIASILTSVDEVIENTQKQIDKLQDLKKATTNDLLTKGIGHTEFKDSELGRIPKRWEVLKLNELCSPTSPITYGVLKPGNYVDGGIPLLQVKDLKDGSVDNSGIHRISTSLDAEYARSRVRFHDILISLIGTVGRVSLMPKVTETYNIHRNIGRIRLENPEWVFLHLQSQIGVQQIQLASSGSSQSALNLSALKEFPVPIPPLKEQSDIVSIISSLSDAITTNYRKLRLTQSLKKSLMQDLLTGKVRVTVN